MSFCWYIALKRLFSSCKIIKFGGGVMNNENWTLEQFQQNQQQNYQPSVRNCNDGQGLSIAALVIGCCAIVFCWIPYLNFLLLAGSIAAIIMGAKGRKYSALAYGKPSGLATAGFVVSIVGTSIVGCFLAFWLSVIFLALLLV